MLLLELTTLSSSTRARRLGITIDEDDLIEVKTSINIDNVTHLSESPDNKNLTNIHLTSGTVIISPYSLEDVVHIMTMSSNDTNDPLDKFNI